MKKILLSFFFLLFSTTICSLSAQTFECNGIYTVTNTSGECETKSCDILVHDNRADMRIFDIPVEVTVYETSTYESGNATGEIYYISEDKSSWIFNGKHDGDKVCVVKIIYSSEEWTFIRRWSNTNE